MKRLFLFVFLLLLSKFCISQTPAPVQGCLLPYNNRVYTVNALEIVGSRQLYSNSTSTGLAANYCSWSATTAVTPCVVCDGLLGVDLLGIRICVGTFRNGNAATYNMVLCDLDDHSWVLGLAAGAFGLIVIRRKRLF